MARGWESKSVEAQQEASIDVHRGGPPVNHESALRRADREALALAKVRAQADLKTASAPAHRSMLEQAIAELDRRIDALDDRA